LTRLSFFNTKITFSGKTEAAAINARSPDLDWSRLTEVELIGKSSFNRRDDDLREVLLAIDASLPELKVLKLTAINFASCPASRRIFISLAQGEIFTQLSELHMENVTMASSVQKILELR
jgi:hypothetical protein